MFLALAHHHVADVRGKQSLASHMVRGQRDLYRAGLESIQGTPFKERSSLFTDPHYEETKFIHNQNCLWAVSSRNRDSNRNPCLTSTPLRCLHVYMLVIIPRRRPHSSRDVHV